MEQERPVCRDLARAVRRAAEGKPYKHLLRRAQNDYRRAGDRIVLTPLPLKHRINIALIRAVAAIQAAAAEKVPWPKREDKRKRPRWKRWPNPAAKVSLIR